jgi:hypothetical protein
MEIDFDHIIQEFEKMGYKAYFDEINNNKIIVIDFDLASRDEPSNLIFTLNSQQMVSTVAQENLNCNILNVLYFFPEIFKTTSINEAKYLANRINCVVLLPGFFVDDLNKRVFYRYSLPWINVSPKDQRLEAAIKLIMNTIDVYTDLFIQISLGASAADLLDTALNDYSMYLQYLAQEQNKRNQSSIE